MKYLVNLEIPQKGMTKSTKEYIADLISKGYNRFQALGSLGGASNGKSVRIANGTVSRV